MGSGKMMTGPAIAAAVAHSLKAHQLVIYSSLAASLSSKLGGVVGAWIATIISVEIGKIVHGETKI